ncbi:amidohydrolase family protein [Humisphaera borealis]|uniref:Amidohydrolase family protein n=1 Tax=Humisphaera borealis TaxID=2807512 RepID=A0A7M2WZY8_9BACT|nr:amidohydrolase family protein [Humisphaera borealis]QOV91056.1 amidohydrolase family protein [Humisphaera borealis]
MRPRLPTRREVLSRAAAGLGALSLPACAPTAGRKPDATVADAAADASAGYIDAHSHIWTPDTDRFPLGRWITRDQMDPPSFTAEQLLATAAPHGVDRVVIIQHAPYYGDDNSYLINCARRFPGRFSVVAIVDERRTDLADHLRNLKRQGVRGLRISPTRYADRTFVKDPSNWLNAPAMRKLWALATEEDLILCPLVNVEHLPTLHPMLADFPGTRVAIDHFGHARADRPDELQALLSLSRHRRVHVKASGFYKFGDARAPYNDLVPMMRHVTEAFGVDRVLWGSDCPYQLQKGNNYGDAVAMVEHDLDFLPLSARKAILRDNAQRLFFA